MKGRTVLLLAALLPLPAQAQVFDGLRSGAPGFELPHPGTALLFPKDHGAHPRFRNEWWYLTANLKGDDGASYGVQWTLFRHALEPGSGDGWDDRNIWMAHAAATSAEEHVFAQKFARGGVGQAEVIAAPFHAHIDDWSFEAPDEAFTRARVLARAPQFSYDLELKSDAPFVLQGEGGYSRKSESGQASYYYSQPFFTVGGTLSLRGRAVKVTGRAWMDREWSSQPLASDQKGWDWLSLHLAGGEKLMLYRMRGARLFLLGNWIAADGETHLLAANDISLEPLAQTAIGERSVPTRWRVKVKSRGLDIATTPLNALSWMGTNFPYWEGPISFSGSQNGEGYLEMTGY
ncbi:iron ABC transporter permease [Methylocystis sp. WRRC1]|uniref:lipocalin-like domain-containing protein n=1 Tax=Methylocystis sp. WRRC1 TaxID=1732014 RepID=UPI001D15165C|nr:lipocalin-like domain-containing protein [Methylocystis sp. WRRC1]MCC3245306.1 iron ABC transporter permease [Methylocystis sp. WRRC1]